MGAPQSRQRPRSSSQLTTGTLSRARMGAPQDVQWERPFAMLSSCASRQAQALMKLPNSRP